MCQVSAEGVGCLSVWRTNSKHLRPRRFQEKTEGSGIKNIVESGVCGLRCRGPGQNMLSDRYPGGEKEEEANNEREKAAVSNQMFF